MRRLRFSLIIFLAIHLFSGALQAAEKKNQLEELLIWKMSDELKLSATEEKKFSQILRELSLQKNQISQKLQKSVETMSSHTKLKEKNDELSLHRKYLVEFSKLSEKEFDELRSLLGTERMVKYLAIKQELTAKLKNMLSLEGSKAKKTLPPPQIIEEK